MIKNHHVAVQNLGRIDSTYGDAPRICTAVIEVTEERLSIIEASPKGILA